MVLKIPVTNECFQATGGIVLSTALTASEKVTGSVLPQVAVGGTVTMTYHQINADGAGPITCQVSADGTTSFAKMTVTANVPGTAGRSNAANEDFVSTQPQRDEVSSSF